MPTSGRYRTESAMNGMKCRTRHSYERFGSKIRAYFGGIKSSNDYYQKQT